MIACCAKRGAGSVVGLLPKYEDYAFVSPLLHTAVVFFIVCFVGVLSCVSEREEQKEVAFRHPKGFRPPCLLFVLDAVSLDVFVRFLCGVRRYFFFCGAYTVQRVSGYKRHDGRWFPTIRAMFTKDRSTYSLGTLLRIGHREPVRGLLLDVKHRRLSSTSSARILLTF